MKAMKSEKKLRKGRKTRKKNGEKNTYQRRKTG